MATTGYCDLGIPGQGGTGSTGNPWRLGDYLFLLSGAAGADFTLLTRGTGIVEDTIRIGTSGSTIITKPWDAELYGPWKLKVLTYWIECTQFNALVTFEGGDISSMSYGIFKYQTLANSYTKFVGCNINLGGQGIGLHRFNQGGVGNTFEFIGCTVNIAGWFNNYPVSNIYKITDSLISCVGLDDTIGSGTFVKNSTVISASTPGTFDRDPVVRTNSQFAIASLPSFPAWNADRALFSSDILSVGITTPPQKGFGYPDYVGYEIGLWGTPRKGIGAMDFSLTSPISSFNVASVSDGDSATSTVDAQRIVDVIQAIAVDSYFDDPAKISSVDITYTHQDGRQKIRMRHSNPAFASDISWTQYTQDGNWIKSLIRVIDWEGAVYTLDQSQIGDLENLSHSSGVMTLNT